MFLMKSNDLATNEKPMSLLWMLIFTWQHLDYKPELLNEIFTTTQLTTFYKQ